MKYVFVQSTIATFAEPELVVVGWRGARRSSSVAAANVIIVVDVGGNLFGGVFCLNEIFRTIMRQLASLAATRTSVFTCSELCFFSVGSVFGQSIVQNRRTHK